jgi:hypothetical protein
MQNTSKAGGAVKEYGSKNPEIEQLPHVSLHDVNVTFGDDVPHNSKETPAPEINSTAQQQSSTGQSSQLKAGPLTIIGSLLSKGFCKSGFSQPTAPNMKEKQIIIAKKALFFMTFIF